ncbi:MAG: DUF3999 family protein [Rhodoferax sp.]|nr:DUF3999 family protein [Rhodoferax sp.]
MKPHNTLAMVSLAVSLCAQAAPGDMPIAVQGAGPHYQVTLPVAAYGLSRNGELGDLRVRNAAGQAIPFAWVRNDTVVHTTATHQVPLFPLPVANAGDATDGALAFVILANGALQPVKKVALVKNVTHHWLMDTSQIRGRLLQAHFEVPATQFGLFALQLEASDDLKRWRSVGRDEQLVRLQYDKQTIERLSVDLGGIQARFLRLRWIDSRHGASISRVTVDSVDDAQPLPMVQWTDRVAPLQCGDDYCDYCVPNGAPLSSLKLQLGQPNTLALVHIYGITDTDTSQPRPMHRTHNPLYALRHQHRPPARDLSPREVLLTDGVVYRLSKPEGEVTSDALQLNGSAWKTLRLRTNGPITSLGSVPPKLSVSVPLKTLVFLGQGERPYSVGLADSSDAKKFAVGAPIAISTLVPNYKPALLAGMEQGSVVVSMETTTPAAAVSTPPTRASSDRRVWLWGALAAGLLLLAGMAWSLLSGLKQSADQDGPPRA